VVRQSFVTIALVKPEIKMSGGASRRHSSFGFIVFKALSKKEKCNRAFLFYDGTYA